MNPAMNLYQLVHQFMIDVLNEDNDTEEAEELIDVVLCAIFIILAVALGLALLNKYVPPFQAY